MGSWMRSGLRSGHIAGGIMLCVERARETDEDMIEALLYIFAVDALGLYSRPIEGRRNHCSPTIKLLYPLTL